MNKLKEGAESFKQFVLDECENINLQLHHLKVENGLLSELKFTQQRRYNALQTKHQDLTSLCLKLTDENERLSKKLTTIGNLSKIELLEKQLAAYAASHADLCKTDKALRQQIENLVVTNANLVDENKNIKELNTCLSKANYKYSCINTQLINFLDSIGYGVEIAPVNKSVRELIKDKDIDALKKLVNQKYHVEEVQTPEEKINSLKDLLVKGLGKNYHVEVLGGDEKSQQVMKDLFGNGDLKSEARRGIKVTDNVKGNPVRDNKGRYTKK